MVQLVTDKIPGLTTGGAEYNRGAHATGSGSPEPEEQNRETKAESPRDPQIAHRPATAAVNTRRPNPRNRAQTCFCAAVEIFADTL